MTKISTYFCAPYMAGIMTQSLHTVWQWGEKHGLVFNPLKTVVCMYETDRKYKNEPPVFMGGKQLLYQNKVKYLGITIDKRLIWSKHVDDRINKCSFLLNKMNSVIGREWGFTPARAKWVYSAIIKPKLTYGCVVWAHAVTKSSKKKLDRLQRRALIHMIRHQHPLKAWRCCSAYLHSYSQLKKWP